MRKIFLIAVFFFGFMLNAQDYGKLTIYSKENQSFIISYNGIRFSNEYVTKSVVNYAEDTDYKVKIWLPRNTFPINFNITSSPGYETVYKLEMDQYGAYALTLESKVQFNAANPTPTIQPSPTVAATPTVPVIKEMSDSDFKAKLASAKTESFDDKRIAKIKFLFANEYLSSAQCAELVRIFSFDTKKVEAGKFLYRKAIDKKNYYKVIDVMTFDSYKKDLQDWINKNPNG